MNPNVHTCYDNSSGGMKYGVEENWRAATAANDDDDSPSTQELPGTYLQCVLVSRKIQISQNKVFGFV